MDRHRVGGGLQIVQDGFFVGPVRDVDAPRSPCCLDISAGLREPGENIGHLQFREGAEEVVWVCDETVALPDLVKNHGVLESVVSAVEKAVQDSKSSFKHKYRFYNARIGIPTNIQTINLSEDLDYKDKTGVTVDETGKRSYELVNYLLIDPPEKFNPIDTEVVEKNGDEKNIWLNRIVYKFHPMTGKARLYQSGEQIFSGNFEEMIARLEKELKQEPAYTSKVKASLEGLPIEHERIYEKIDFDEDVTKFFDLDV